MRLLTASVGFIRKSALNVKVVRAGADIEDRRCINRVDLGSKIQVQDDNI
jgi:hypothetical protein